MESLNCRLPLPDIDIMQRTKITSCLRCRDAHFPILDGAAGLLSEPGNDRIRQSEACVLHFFDTSKKGSRRWCSMNICGNKLKVARNRQ